MRKKVILQKNYELEKELNELKTNNKLLVEENSRLKVENTNFQERLEQANIKINVLTTEKNKKNSEYERNKKKWLNGYYGEKYGE